MALPFNVETSWDEKKKKKKLVNFSGLFYIWLVCSVPYYHFKDEMLNQATALIKLRIRRKLWPMIVFILIFLLLLNYFYVFFLKKKKYEVPKASFSYNIPPSTTHSIPFSLFLILFPFLHTLKNLFFVQIGDARKEGNGGKIYYPGGRF